MGVVVISKGDNFSLETETASGGFKASATGVEVNGSGDRKQRDKESIHSLVIIPKNGRSRVRFHGNQSQNYVSTGFFCDGKHKFVVVDRLLDAGSRIHFKSCPENSNAFAKVVD